MELSEVHVFLAVVRTGSISAAAIELDQAPSWTSTQIRHLETGLGCLLFDRTRTGMALTGEGTAFQEWAERIVALVGEAERAIGQRRRTLHLGALETLAATHAPRIVKDLNARHPELVVRVRPYTRGADLQPALQRGELDAALLLATSPSTDESGDATVTGLDLAEVELCAVVAPTHPLAHLATVTSEDLRSYPVLVTVEGGTFRRAIENLVLPGQAVEELMSVAVVRAWAKQGLGFALLPDYAVEDDLESSALVRFTLEPAPGKLHLRLLWRNSKDVDTDLSQLLYSASAAFASSASS